MIVPDFSTARKLPGSVEKQSTVSNHSKRTPGCWGRRGDQGSKAESQPAWRFLLGNDNLRLLTGLLRTFQKSCTGLKHFGFKAPGRELVIILVIVFLHKRVLK